MPQLLRTSSEDDSAKKRIARLLWIAGACLKAGDFLSAHTNQLAAVVLFRTTMMPSRR